MSKLEQSVTAFAEMLEQKKSTQYLPEQPVYVIEECSELIKELTKSLRQKGNEQNIVDESIDILTTIFVMLKRMNVKPEYVENRIIGSIERAAKRLDTDNEL